MAERDVLLNRLLAQAELSPDEVQAIEDQVLAPAAAPRAPRALRLAFAPLAFAAAALAVMVIVTPPPDDGFAARGGGSLGAALQVLCARDGAIATCAPGASLGVRVASPAAVALLGSDGVLRPLALEAPGEHSARLDVPPGTYEVVALPGGTLAALAAAVDARDPRLLRAPLEVGAAP